MPGWDATKMPKAVVGLSGIYDLTLRTPPPSPQFINDVDNYTNTIEDNFIGLGNSVVCFANGTRRGRDQRPARATLRDPRCREKETQGAPCRSAKETLGTIGRQLSIVHSRQR